MRHKTNRPYTGEIYNIENLLAKHDFGKNGPKKILLIDDDPNIHELFKQYLKDYDKRIILQTHQDEEKAIDSFAFDLPDLIIMDYYLKHTNGASLSGILNGLTYFRIPTVFISGNNEVVEDLYNQFQYKVLYIPKPLSKIRVFEYLDYCLSV